MTKTTTGRVLLSLLFCGAVPLLTTGCGTKQEEPPAPPPPAPSAKLNASQAKFVATAKNMSPQQQAEFFRQHPEMTRDSSVMRKLSQEMPKMKIEQKQGQKPRLRTGRPDFVAK